MKVLRPLGDEGIAQARLRELESHYDRAVEIMETRINRISEGEDITKTEADRLIYDTHRAIQSYLDARKKIEDELKKEAGIAREHTIDFKAARSKIGSLLDRIRNAGGSEGVS